MLFKIIFVFLLSMVLVGMVGKVLFPNKLDRLMQLRMRRLKAPVCPSCGRYMIGQTGCDCGKS